MLSYLFFAIICLTAQSWAGMIAENQCDVLFQCWKTADGKVIAAWRKSEDGNTVDVQLARPDNGDRTTPLYVGLGLSADGVMGDDFVTECVFVGDQATVHLSYNIDHSNKRLPEDHSNMMVKLVESRRAGDELYCRYTQTITPPQDIGQIPNLDNSFYVVYVTGTATATNINIHDKLPPVAFSSQVNMAKTVFSGSMPVGPVAVPINGIPPLVAATRPPPPLPNGVTEGVTQPTGSGITGTFPPLPEPEVTKANTQSNSVSEPEPSKEPKSEPEPGHHSGADKVTSVALALFITLLLTVVRL